MNLTSLIYQFAIGFEQAATSLIGQQIGKGDLNKALKFFDALKVVAAIGMTVSSCLLYFFKRQIMGFFTSDQNLLESALSVTWVLTFSTFPDGFKGMLKGVIRALGIQHLALFVNLVGHWIINLSL